MPVNPASSEAEFAGLIGQVEPLAVLTDPELEPAINVAVQQAGKAAGGCEALSMWIQLAMGRPGERSAELPTPRSVPMIWPC